MSAQNKLWFHQPLLRVSVIGTSGSGKTTFARQLAERADLVHIELDSLHWLPGWQERPPAEFMCLVTEAMAEERWVMDGNYSRLRPMVWQRSTHVVWLNYPFPFVFWRVLTRTVRRALVKEELWDGNYESLHKSFFSRDSILLWVINTHRRRKRDYRKFFDDNLYPHLECIEIHSQRQAEAFLNQVSPGA
jgi:adenylate kinase family enzyme